MKSEINISLSHQDEFISRFSLNEDLYDCGTENLARRFKIVTRIYLRGEICHSVTSDYAHMAKFPKLQEKVAVMMEKQHRSAIESFSRKRSDSKKTRAEYAEEVREILKGGDRTVALEVVKKALEGFPSDPFFLSYCGYLVSVVEKRPRDGIVMCERAIDILKKSGSADSVFFLPLFYLNLGRTCLRGGRKKSALEAFQEGLKYDHGDKGLLSEVRSLGIRKRPVIPFLKRSHPLNKYMGRMRERMKAGK